mmetsp:Transcript_21343/g.45423  ORF Transcript_21343/g.45423 Transcript_21343/m.45423 type:complete len:590 (-) Transcript_21343:39-1808(-)
MALVGQSPPGSFRMADLELHSLLGEGAFARVLRARDRRDGKEYAVKIVEKRKVQAQGRRNSVQAEKAMLSSLDHPGIVRLHFALQDDWSLFFILELVGGGELATQLARMGVCPLDTARFYTAEIVVILAYLRSRRVAHRDLKPENLLLTTEGHLKLVDFDAAVIVPDEGEGDAAGGLFQGQPSVAGTSLYLPPEVLMSVARPQEAFALDLWALGCILFLMLVGESPWHAPSEYLAFQRILKGDYEFPRGFPHRAAQELVCALLAAEPSARPGAGSKGLTALELHAFFGGSQASFIELRQRRPPRMVSSRERLGRHSDGAELGFCRTHSQASPSNSLSRSFDFASSAECTPEVGQNFLAQRCTQIIPGPHWLAEGDGKVGREVASTSCCDEVSTEPLLNPASPSVEPTAATTRRLTSPPRLTWRAVADLPGVSWRHWLQELVQRKMLLREEDIAICGRVVLRRVPCLRPKVLVLTDLPRILVLDASGLRLQHSINLVGSPLGESCGGDFVAAAISVSVRSATDFVLCAGGRSFRCCDMNLGAAAWMAEIQSAQARTAAEAQSARCDLCPSDRSGNSLAYRAKLSPAPWAP